MSTLHEEQLDQHFAPYVKHQTDVNRRFAGSYSLQVEARLEDCGCEDEDDGADV